MPRILNHHWSPRASDFDWQCYGVLAAWASLHSFGLANSQCHFEQLMIPPPPPPPRSHVRQNIALDSHAAPSIFSLSNQRQIRFGGASTSILTKMTRTSARSPLFLFHDCATLSRNRLVSGVREALAASGHDLARYSGHNFRIGAATSREEVSGLDHPDTGEMAQQCIQTACKVE